MIELLDRMYALTWTLEQTGPDTVLARRMAEEGPAGDLGPP